MPWTIPAHSVVVCAGGVMHCRDAVHHMMIYHDVMVLTYKALSAGT